MSELRKLAEARGIADVLYGPAQANEGQFAQQGGWYFPVWEKGKEAARKRWKNASSNGQPKYASTPGKGDVPRYYFLPGLKEHVQDTIYIVEGEMDLWTMHAAGVKNVLCWNTGAKAVPNDLCTVLRALQVERVVMIVDADEPGYASAAKVINKLADDERMSVDVFCPYPNDFGSGKDLNDLWCELGFDGEVFQSELAELAPINDDVMMYLPVSTGSNHQQMGFDDSEDWFAEWVETVKRQLEPDALTGKKHAHCPLPNHEDKNPSFRISFDKLAMGRPVCSCALGTMEVKEAWMAVADAVGAQSWDSYKSTKQAKRKEKQQHERKQQHSHDVASGKTSLPDVLSYMTTSDDVLNEIEFIIREKVPLDYRPFITPFDWLHHFGGAAEMIEPGTMVGIISVSGGGKTTFWEHWCEIARRTGHSWVIYSPEWSAQRLGYRMLQRETGVPKNAITRMRLYENEKRAGVSYNHAGIGMGDEKRQELIDALVELKARQGKYYYVEADKLPEEQQRQLDIDQLLAMILATVRYAQSQGSDVAGAVIDYLQLMTAFANTSTSNWAWAETLVGKIKAWSYRHKITVYVVSQATQAHARSVRKGGMVGTTDGQGISDQKFQLYFALTPEYDDKQEKTGVVRLTVGKNNEGLTGSVRLSTKFDRLMFGDPVEDEDGNDDVVPVLEAQPDEDDYFDLGGGF